MLIWVVFGVWSVCCAEFCAVRVLILLCFSKSLEKGAKSGKNRLRVSAVILRTPFTGGAEAHDGALDGAAGMTRSEAKRKISRFISGLR